jgi:hypothetical protein
MYNLFSWTALVRCSLPVQAAVHCWRHSHDTCLPQVLRVPVPEFRQLLVNGDMMLPSVSATHQSALWLLHAFGKQKYIRYTERTTGKDC